MIWSLIQVALGGALGAVARFAVQSGVARLFGAGFPLGTLTVNVVGSFAMGVAVIWLAEKGMLRAAPFLMAGFLGAFTTFSTFSLDAMALWERGLPWQAGGYAAASVVLSVAAVVAGAALARGWAV
ncbi:fluoride efflux transporter CrcB [Rhodobacteraceae bacterium WD3A24]|nr:fluoride efflux transporter CrcB [Rhodobacteraceae bacterium WD3A24]